MNMDKNKDSRACDSASAFARNDNKKVDSSLESTFDKTAQSLSPAPALSLRALKKGEAIHKATAQKVDSSVKADSRSDYSASAECMDCHANASAFARNDDKKVDSSLESTFDNATNLSEPAKDSRSNAQSLNDSQAATPTPSPSDSKISRLESTFDNATNLSELTKDSRNAQSLNDSQAAGFADDFLKKPASASPCTAIACFASFLKKHRLAPSGVPCFQGGGEGIYLAESQAPAAESSKSAAKPTPKERPCDSKISRLESGLFKPRKEIRLERLSTQRGEEIHDSSPKAESPQAQKIPLIDLHAQYHAHKPELDSAIASVLHSQHFILGEHSQALESELASFVGRRFCITCSSGTSALLLALLALDIGAGDEVITPSFSFIAAAEMVAFLGAKPVFVDICPHTYTLDIAQVKHAISPRTRAIIPVSLFGQPYDVAGLESLAKPHAIPIIEDGAQSFGAAITLGNGAKSARSGSFGDLSVTSFFPSKPLGGYGDGGAVFCDDETLATKLYALRNHGQASKYRHTMLGLNARLDELQCAILRVKLRHFASELHLREQVAARYCTLLAPLQKHLALPYIAPNRTSVFAQFCLRVKDSREDWVVGRHLPDLAQHNQSSSQAAQSGVAIHTKKADSSIKVDSRSDYSASAECIDCHANASAFARNDRQNTDNQKVDSSVESTFDKTAQNAFDSQATGGRIFDEKAGLCSLLCGDKTDGLSHKQKANSPLFRKKPTPTQQKMDSSTTITRTHIISALNAQGIATAIHYPTPLHLQEVFSHLGYKKGDFPISEQIAQEIFSIPFSPYLTEATQEHIARVLREIFAQI